MQSKNDYVHSQNPLWNTSFPFLTLEVENKICSPKNLGFRMMHWHEDVQFILILKGQAHFRTVSHSFDLNAGEAVFINKEVLHQTIPEPNCHYRSFIFPEYFLMFYPGSIMAQQDVLPITGNPSIPAIAFRALKPWHKKILCMLRDLNQLVIKKDTTKFYEYEVLTKLVNLWLIIISNIETATMKLPKSDICRQERMRAFLAFIHQHYADDITLDDIAKSANVSKTECIRCFSKILQITPYEYLLNYRLTKSIELLKRSDDSITTVAYKSGFKHSSYYAKYFKQIMKMTPSDYRKS